MLVDFMSCYKLNPCQNVSEFCVIHLYAVVKIKGDHLVGEVVDFFFIPLQLQRLIFELCNALVELDAFGRSGGGKAVLRHLDLRAVALLLLVDIIGAHACKQVGAVAVQIDQRLEAVLFARGKEPVDRALLVDFAVILIKIVQKVFADHLA